LFAIGSSAYSKMMKDSMDQVIIISGESGAGKTGNFSNIIWALKTNLFLFFKKVRNF
jgi:myosin heavy subunit